MDRKEFLTKGTLVGLTSIIDSNNAFSQNLTTNNIDKLVDVNGNFVHQPLPYAENFLEPYMDTETLHLHYTFHHGGAVKGANKDLAMIKKALDDNNFETVDFWTKKLSFHSSSHILHSIFWTNLTNKPTTPTGELLKRIDKSFGSYDRLKALIGATSKNMDGNGWGILAYQPYSDSLTILQCENSFQRLPIRPYGQIGKFMSSPTIALQLPFPSSRRYQALSIQSHPPSRQIHVPAHQGADNRRKNYRQEGFLSPSTGQSDHSLHRR